MTHRGTWKRAERVVASFFGAMRQRCSGSSGRPDETRSDSTHPTLFIETKYRVKHAVRTLYDATRKLAEKEGKVPVVCLVDKQKEGFLVVVHSDCLADFLEVYEGHLWSEDDAA